MVTFRDSALAEKMEKLRTHGTEISKEQRHHGAKPYMLLDLNLSGFKYRLADLLGSVGLVQLGKLERFLTERQKWTKFYKEELSYIGG